MEISNDTIHSLNFFNYKTPFFGSHHGMHYKIECVKNEAEEKQLETTIWKGPFNLKTTTEEKVTNIFPFSEEGRNQVITWLNEQYVSKKWN